MVKVDLNNSISNTWVRLTEARRVALQANDARAGVLFPSLVRFILGENSTPRLLPGFVSEHQPEHAKLLI